MTNKKYDETPFSLTKEEVIALRKKQQDKFINPSLDPRIPLHIRQKIELRKKKNLNNPEGLGDRVEKIAQPIAKIIDKIAGTNIQGCGGCQKRKEYLNKKFPKI